MMCIEMEYETFSESDIFEILDFDEFDVILDEIAAEMNTPEFLKDLDLLYPCKSKKIKVIKSHLKKGFKNLQKINTKLNTKKNRKRTVKVVKIIFKGIGIIVVIGLLPIGL